MYSRLFSFAVAGLMLAGIALTPAKADEWDKRTVVKFNKPVEIPGRVLPAGTYVMRLLDSPSDRDIVQFFNKDETRLIDTVLAIPDYRLTPTGHTVITFEERAAGAPQAIRTWYYPGDNYGQEFVYRHAHQMMTAQNVSPNPPPSTAAPAPATKPIQQAAAPQPAEMAKANPEPAPTPAPEPAPAPQAQPAPKPVLPKTASDVPLISLLGGLALAAGITLRRKQTISN